MRFILTLALSIFLIPLAPLAAQDREAEPTPVILISIDGFRYDYLERGLTPRLSALAAQGTTTAMRPSFPTKTFPNHWAMVTGKVPDRNGIVANRFVDPRRPQERFSMASSDPFWWNEAEPIWSVAEKAGIRTASMFWPGSNVAWGGEIVRDPRPRIAGGTRPSDWIPFDGEVTPRQRVDTVLDWMRRPPESRPRFVTLYFEAVDSAGHHYGPDDPRTNESLSATDAEIGRLVDGLAGMERSANLVIVSDHGMVAVSEQRIVRLTDFVDQGTFTTIESGPFASIIPEPGMEDIVARKLAGQHEHMECWRREDIPARLRYGQNPRVTPVFCLAEQGWTIVENATSRGMSGGTHGYDNADPGMAALFIAAGPDIRAGQRLTMFDNVDVTALLRELLDLPADPQSDGDAAPFAAILRR